MAIAVLITLMHLLIVYWLAIARGSVPAPELMVPAIDVTLFEFGGGGGSPAGDQDSAEPTPLATPSSAVHVPLEPRPWDDQPQAPATAAAQELIVTAGSTTLDGQTSAQAERAPITSADTLTGSAGLGSGAGGGSGDGSGTGFGPGSGPGIGRGTGAILIRGPAGATISQNVSESSLAGMKGGYGVLRCAIRLDQRLGNCRVLREYPAGSGHGRLALARAEEFRFRPPYRAGRFRGNHRITVAIAFPPPLETASSTP